VIVASPHALAGARVAENANKDGAGVRAYVGLGSNLDQPIAQIRQAFQAFESIPQTRLIRHAGLYRNPPLGPPQPDYVNSVAALDTGLAPHDLLAALQAVEWSQGRVRGALRWGPRTLDLDLLLYGERTIDCEDLVVPHPRLHERAFVLIPLHEIAPRIEIPGYGPLEALLGAVAGAKLVRVDG